MYRLSFYVPASHLDSVKDAVFAAGAGRYGRYDQCCWQVLGSGQFRPLAGADPHLGAVGTLEHVPEWRVELVLDDAVLRDVVGALLDSHPYEEPGYGVVHLVDV